MVKKHILIIDIIWFWKINYIYISVIGKKMQSLKHQHKKFHEITSLDHVKNIWDFDVLKGQKAARQKLQKKVKEKYKVLIK